MKTFFIVLLITEILAIFIWLYIMIGPLKLRGHFARFKQSWEDGGVIFLMLMLFGALCLAAGITKTVLMANFLEGGVR